MWSRFGVHGLVPDGALADGGEQVGVDLEEGIHKRRVELAATAFSHDRGRRRRAPVYGVDVSHPDHVAESGDQRDCLAGAQGEHLPIPPSEDLLERAADARPDSHPLGQAAGRLAAGEVRAHVQVCAGSEEADHRPGAFQRTRVVGQPGDGQPQDLRHVRVVGLADRTTQAAVVAG